MNPEHIGLPSTFHRKKKGNSSIVMDMHPNIIGNHLETFSRHIHGTLINVNYKVHGPTYVVNTVYFTLVTEQGALVYNYIFGDFIGSPPADLVIVSMMVRSWPP